MENNKVTIINKLKKEIYKGFTLFELILFTSFSIIGVSVFLFTILSLHDASASIKVSYAITLVDIPVGIIAATSLSKKSRYAPLLLIFDSLLYGTSNFLVGNYSLGFVNAIATPILLMVAFFFLWKNESKEKNKEIKTRKLDLKIGILLTFIVIIIATSLALAMHWNSINDDDPIIALNVWFDSFAASLMLAAVIMGVFRFREVWYLYLLANVLKIILFTINLSTGNSEDLMLLIMSSAYLINSIFGLFVWYDSKRISIL